MGRWKRFKEEAKALVERYFMPEDQSLSEHCETSSEEDGGQFFCAKDGQGDYHYSHSLATINYDNHHLDG